VILRIAVRVGAGCLFVALAVGAGRAAADPTGTEVTIPLTVSGALGDKTVSLVATEYTPSGRGPFPAIVQRHGSPSNSKGRVKTTGRYPVASAVRSLHVTTRRSYDRRGAAAGHHHVGFRGATSEDLGGY
jgi:hypothetical protein